MKVIAISASIITLLYLIYAFISQTSEIQLTENNIAELRSVTPVLTGETRLEVEKAWRQLKEERNKPKKPVVKKEKKKPVINKDIFSIGDKKYVLFGIFNADITKAPKKTKRIKPDNQAFILIKSYDDKKQTKAPKSELLKIIQGNELSPGIKLVALSSDSISFKHEDDIIKVKLFETKK